MSGHEDERSGSTLGRAERAQGRRALVGYSFLFLGIGAMGFAGFRPLRWLGAGGVIIGAVLVLSGPRETWGALTPHNVRKIARMAEVPEVGGIMVVYGCLIVALAGAIVMLAKTI